MTNPNLYEAAGPGGLNDPSKLQPQIEDIRDQLSALSDRVDEAAEAGLNTALIFTLQTEVNDLRSSLDQVITDKATAPQLSIPAWDDQTPRVLIGLGNAIVEGSGITISKVDNTSYLSIASSPAAQDVDALHLLGLNSAKPTTAADGAFYTAIDTNQLWAFMATSSS